MKAPFIIQKLTVMDQFGRILIEKEINKTEQNLDLSGFGKGVYFIRCEMNEKQVIRRVSIK